MERMLEARLVFFKGRISRERIDGEFFVGERFMNNDGCYINLRLFVRIKMLWRSQRKELMNTCLRVEDGKVRLFKRGANFFLRIF